MLPFRGMSSRMRLAVMGGGLLALVGAEGALLFFLSSRAVTPTDTASPVVTSVPIPAPTEQVFTLPGVSPPPPIGPANPSTPPGGVNTNAVPPPGGHPNGSPPVGNPPNGTPPDGGKPSGAPLPLPGPPPSGPSLFPPSGSPNPNPAAPDPHMEQAAKLFDQASAALKSGDKKGAVVLWEKVIKIAPNDLSTRQNLALIYDELKRPGDAIPHARAAVKIAPNDPKAQYQLAHLLLETNHAKAAIEPLRETIRLKPDAFELYPELAASLIAAKDRPGAIAAYQGALSHVPKGAGAGDTEGRLRVALGRLYGQGKQPKDARDQFVRASQLLPRDPEPLELAAMAETELKNLSGATRLLGKAIALDPKNPRTRLFYAQTLAQNKQWKEAEAQFDSYCTSQPSDKEALFQWARVAHELNSPSRETEALGRLVALRPGEAPLWSQLSSAQLAAGRKSDALNSLQKAASLAPRDAAMALSVAKMQSDAGDARGAMATLQKALGSRPDYAPLYFEFLKAGDATSQKDEARDFIAQKLANQPQNGAALSGVLKFYDDKKRSDDAHALLNAIVARNPKATLAKNALASYAPPTPTTAPTTAP